MPSKISKTKQDKVSLMIQEGFSNSEIARALKIDDQTVKNYRREEKRDVRTKENIGSKKTTGKETTQNGF